MMDMLFRAAKGIPEVSYTALKARGKKISGRRLLLHKKFPKIIQKAKELYVQNINSIFLELSYGRRSKIARPRL
jgi:hypothetical protein